MIAIQRFFLGFTVGTANVGKYNFNPPNRAYTAISTNQTGQNYDALVFGDVASGFVHRPTDGSQEVPNAIAPTVMNVALPKITATGTTKLLAAPVSASTVDGKNKLVGFEGDFTFDERAVKFDDEPVQKAGLTAGNWNVAGNVLPGSGPIRILRVSGYSTDFQPLSGAGTLFELRVNTITGGVENSALVWVEQPNQFIFINTDLQSQQPGTTTPGTIALPH